LQAGVVAAGGKALAPSGQLVLKLPSALLHAQPDERDPGRRRPAQFNEAFTHTPTQKVAGEKCWL
jgi:hypothetical protein